MFSALRKSIAEALWPCSRDHAERDRDLQILIKAGQAMSSLVDINQVLSATITHIVSNTRFRRACVSLGPDTDGSFRIAASFGLPSDHLQAHGEILNGPSGAYAPDAWSRLAAQPVVIEDVTADFRIQQVRSVFQAAGIGSIVTAPLIAKDRYYGALSVYLDTPARFTAGEVCLVGALSSQAALAVENAHLYMQTAEHKQRLDRALEFLEQAAAGLAKTRVGVQPFLQNVGQAAARIFSPANIHLVVNDNHGRDGWIVSEAHGTDAISAAEVRRGLVSGGDPGFASRMWPAALCLPISLDGQRHGHMEVFLAGEGRRLGSEDRSILQAFAHLTSSALGNAQLVSELRHAVSDAERAYMGTLEALTRVLEMRDHETEGHCRRVVQYTLALAQILSLPEDEMVPMIRGALLHDIGKVAIPDGILHKAGPLNPDEWDVMRTHTIIGHEMLFPIEFLRDSTPIILHHHERYDGSGYPGGLCGHEIPVGARIFAVADAFDAITSDRPYRKGRTCQEAMDEIMSCSRTHFDPEVVKAFAALPAEELARIRRNWLSPVSAA